MDPLAEYTSRRDARQLVVERQKAREGRFADARMTVFVAGLVMVFLLLGPKVLAPYWLALPLVAFIALVIAHDRVAHERKRAERAVAFYDLGLARLGDAWAGKGEAGTRYFHPSHPYAEDLDVFGPGSLFELLCTARTRAGEGALARWLCEAAAPDEVRARQQAVDDLRPRLDLREDLALLGADVRESGDPDAFVAWGAAGRVDFPPAFRVIARILGALNVVNLAGWIFLGFGPLPFALTFVPSMILARVVKPRVQEVVEAVEKRERDVELLCELMERLGRERFTATKLAALRSGLSAGGPPAYEELARLRRLLHLLDSRRNELFVAISVLVLFVPLVAVAIEAWRLRGGPSIPRWLAALGELEALSALAGYAYEHPSDPFPEFADAGPCYEGEQLGHPLIAHKRCVRNDATLGNGTSVLVVSGSNMSGKSTYLRTVGANAVLAMMGAPVRAKRLRLSPLSVGASIRRTDSLQDGTSHFYAEIKRIRQLVDLAQGPRPALFLVDEILHGTNSHDRTIGSAAIVKGFIGRGAIGLVTTHDLSLAKVADELAPKAVNVHFEDQLVDGRMVFDYKLRPGVVTKSNALELMRSLGLDV